MSAPKKFRGYSFTVEDWLALCETHGNKCAHCGEEKPLVVDHIVPRIAGGTDQICNIQPLCNSCNGKKGSFHDGVRVTSHNCGYEVKKTSMTVDVTEELRERVKAAAALDDMPMSMWVRRVLNRAASAKLAKTKEDETG